MASIDSEEERGRQHAEAYTKFLRERIRQRLTDDLMVVAKAHINAVVDDALAHLETTITEFTQRDTMRHFVDVVVRTKREDAE